MDTTGNIHSSLTKECLVLLNLVSRLVQTSSNQLPAESVVLLLHLVQARTIWDFDNKIASISFTKSASSCSYTTSSHCGHNSIWTYYRTVWSKIVFWAYCFVCSIKCKAFLSPVHLPFHDWLLDSKADQSGRFWNNAVKSDPLSQSSPLEGISMSVTACLWGCSRLTETQAQPWHNRAVQQSVSRKCFFHSHSCSVKLPSLSVLLRPGEATAFLYQYVNVANVCVRIVLKSQMTACTSLQLILPNC